MHFIFLGFFLQKDRSSGVLQFGCFADLYGKHTYHFMERYSSFEHIVNFRSLPEHTKFMNDVCIT
jgi:hypothetical protein